MEKWVAHYEQNQVYPPQVLSQIRAAIDPTGANKAAAAKRADPRQKAQMQPRAAAAVMNRAHLPRLDMPAHAVRIPPYLHSTQVNGAGMPPRPPGAPLVHGMMPPAPALGTSFAGIRLQVCGGKNCAETCLKQGLCELSGSTLSLCLAVQCSLCYHRPVHRFNSILRFTMLDSAVRFRCDAGSMRNRAFCPSQLTNRLSEPSVSLLCLGSLLAHQGLTNGSQTHSRKTRTFDVHIDIQQRLSRTLERHTASLFTSCEKRFMFGVRASGSTVTD